MSGFIETILICNNGKDAFDQIEALFIAGKKLPELILLDLNMPVWNGWEFLDKFTLIETKQSITIFILTSSVNLEDKKRAARYGMKSNYIVKPITINLLKEILQNEL
jgi:CheY-like chemotaxis protein